jgi:hypothetical protein
MKEIQIYLDKETKPHHKKNVNIGWSHLKILLSRTNNPEKLRVA